MSAENLGPEQKPGSTNISSYNTTQNNLSSNSLRNLFKPASPKMQELMAKFEAILAAEGKHKSTDPDCRKSRTA